MHLNILWQILQPFLFGSLGAMLLFSKLNGEVIGFAFSIIICGCLIKIITVFFISSIYDYSIRERMFISSCWFPKATAQAALGGVFLSKATALGTN
jgi:NhaP-type Na+/H+ or K+/H+ antiporter